MELRQLRYFIAIVEHRSISRAAEHLRISQPALTRQLHQLERHVGTPLFEHVPSGVSPTPAALALHEHARVLSAAAAQDVHPDWVFAWFTENAYACALASAAAAALLTRPSAQRLLPGWRWIPLDEPGLGLPLWLAQHPQARTIVTAVA